MSEYRAGIWYGVAAYVLWGLSPLFWNLVDDIDTLELLFHRIIWAVPLLALALTLRRQWRQFAADYRVPRARLISATAAVLLAVNWGVYLWAVTHEQVVEASLGYFINPLVSVALGVVVLHERLRRLQWIAVGVAAIGVLGMAVRVETFPWVSLALAFSFGFYGLLKKRPETPRPLDSLFGEVAVLALPATLGLLLVGGDGEGLGSSPGTTVFLLATGAMTVVPLLLFGAAAKRVPLSTVGLLQYIAPTLQFIIGVAIYGETLGAAKLTGFVFVWAGLAIYSYDTARSSRVQDPVAA